MKEHKQAVKRSENETETPTHKQAVKRSESETETPTLLPRVDVFEDAGGITLIADMPGVPHDKLDLHVDGDTLQIEGEIAPDTPENMEALYAEIQVARYRRGFTLSSELDPEHIDAQFKDGLLRLHIPKHEHAQPRRIEVQVA